MFTVIMLSAITIATGQVTHEGNKVQFCPGIYETKTVCGGCATMYINKNGRYIADYNNGEAPYRGYWTWCQESLTMYIDERSPCGVHRSWSTTYYPKLGIWKPNFKGCKPPNACYSKY